MKINIETRISDIGKEVIKKANVYKFKTSSLPDLNDYKTDIRTDSNFIELFKELDSRKQNCIYWFSLGNEKEADLINSCLDDNRKKLKQGLRVVPPKNKNAKSKTLYVGIRRGGVRKRDLLSNISGRIIQHLGYYEKGSTQGLQLIHWVKNERDVTFYLNVVELVDIPNEYLNVIEEIVAYLLKPLCGQH